MDITGSRADERLGLIPRLILAAGPVLMVAALGSAATLPNIPGWYEGLAKPPFTPPNWVFGPAWTLLYGLMAAAVLRILSLPPELPGRRRAVALFFAQLALNGGWSWAFFAGRNPGLGLFVIVLLVAAIVATIAAFRRLDLTAAWLLAPYLAWVLFATYLNGGVWLLNR